MLASGAVVRVMRPEPPVVEWEGGGSAPALRGAVAGATAREREAAAPLQPGERIDPNTASEAQLRRLPRVGPAVAARILDYRQRRGGFRSLADLDSVPGIGPALLAGIAPHVALPPHHPFARRAASDPPRRCRYSGCAAARPENTATAAEFQRLPGVGPVLAARIAEWRRLHGRFRSVAQLEEVSGVGRRWRARLEPHLFVNP